MANLVAIIDPITGREYRVHPFIAANGEWFPRDKQAFRALFPGVNAFERDLACLAAQHVYSATPDAVSGETQVKSA